MFGDLFFWCLQLGIVMFFVFIIILVSTFFVRFIMQSLGYLQEISGSRLVLWSLGTSIFVMILETLGRFFLISIDVQLHYATHILAVFCMHILYFIIAGLAVRALLAHRHVIVISAKEATIFMTCIGVCFYFLLGSLAGAVIYVANTYVKSASRKIIIEKCSYVQGLRVCLTNKKDLHV